MDTTVLPMCEQSHLAERINLKVDFLRSQIVVVIPAYNEERFIGSVVLKILQFPVKVLVVDDGSQDDTALVAERAGAHVIRQPQNKGKGAALNLGFQKAREMTPDVIVVLDGDGQHLATDLPGIVQPILEDRADIVVGSRYIRHTSKVPASRVWGHRLINLITKVSSGVNVSDSQSGYRAFSPNAFRVDHFCSNGFSVESEMQFLAREYNLRVMEVPITIYYPDRPKRSAVGQGLLVLNGILKLMGQYRPLLFFSIPGGVLLVAGILLGIWVIQRFDQIHQLATGTALISILLSILGLIMVSTGFTLHSIRGLLIDYLKNRHH